MKMKKNRKNNKAQSFSTDIIIVIIIVLFGTLFLVMNKINNVENNDGDIKEVYSQASSDSKIIVNELKSQEIIDDENKVSVNKLLQLNENELREKLGIKNEFAIVFEKDGKLIKLDPENNVNCIGSNNIIVNGQSCSN